MLADVREGFDSLRGLVDLLRGLESPAAGEGAHSGQVHVYSQARLWVSSLLSSSTELLDCVVLQYAPSALLSTCRPLLMRLGSPSWRLARRMPLMWSRRS